MDNINIFHLKKLFCFFTKLLDLWVQTKKHNIENISSESLFKLLNDPCNI